MPDASALAVHSKAMSACLGAEAAHGLQTLRVSTGDRVQATVFIVPKDTFAIVMLSAQIDFVSKRKPANAAAVMELDAAHLTAHLQSRFGTQVSLHNMFMQSG